ncbi:MAG: FliO/MopB family protein [Sphingomonadales bacterium]|nr:FliO/MopB family protein [Sphingomonadales bacterium]
MDSPDYLRFLAALIFVLALLGGFAWLARRFGLAPRATVAKSAVKRLSVSEILPLDARRRLMLIRRDNVEHLVLIGDGETVIEQNITPPPAMPASLEGRS